MPRPVTRKHLSMDKPGVRFREAVDLLQYSGIKWRDLAMSPCNGKREGSGALSDKRKLTALKITDVLLPRLSLVLLVAKSCRD